MADINPPAIICEHVSLAPLTTIEIGGPARYFAKVENTGELERVLGWAKDANLPVFILGGGSNVLFADSGFQGVVIQSAFKGIETNESADSVVVKVGAGENWDSFTARAVESGWQGIECLSGIPGSAGASPIQNIGAYGQEVCETILEVEAWDRVAQKLHVFQNAECDFAYRSSRFKRRDRDTFVVVSVSFRLVKNSKPTLKYAELSRYFDEQGMSNPTLAEVRRGVREIRMRKAMVIDPAEPNSRSCGSFFMNPIIPRLEFENIVAQGRARNLLKGGETIPCFDAGTSMVKLSAAWLMEHAGLKRGERHGNIGLSEKHVLAIINRGGGTAAEVLELVNTIQEKVRSSFGIELEPEPVIAG